jgi:tol-pal system protein YbgF
MRFEFKRQALASLLALTLLGAGNANAALFEDDEARRAILDLRQRLEAVNNAAKAQADDNAQLRRVLMELQSQIDNMQAELNKSRGAQEQLARDVSDLQLRQRDAQTGLDERLRRFEPTSVKLDGLEFQAEQAEKRDYDAAMDVFRKGDFVAAQTSLQRFVQRYPQTGYMPSALFWLGNASYAVKDYKGSLAQFRQMLTLSPTHARAPEAMLAVSNVQLELKDIKAARKTLEDLVKAFPQSDAAQAAKDRLLKLR